MDLDICLLHKDLIEDLVKNVPEADSVDDIPVLSDPSILVPYRHKFIEALKTLQSRKIKKQLVIIFCPKRTANH